MENNESNFIKNFKYATNEINFGTEHGSKIEVIPGAVNIKDGSDRETYATFDDEPKAGTKPDPPPPPPEEKKGFNWGGLLVLAVAAVAVVASVVTFGIGAVLIGAAIGACVGAACAAVSTAVSDHINGTQSSLGTYAKNMLKGALTGAVSGAIFGPLGSFESLGGVMAFGGINGMADSVLNQAIDGKFSLKQTLLDGLIGAATGGLLHGAGKLISKVSPFVSKSIGNVLGKISGEAKSILGKISGKADDILGAFSKTSKELFNKVANKVDDVATNIKNSAQDLVDRAANKFNEVTTKIDNKIQDALDYVRKPVDKFLIENEAVLQNLAKNLDDTFSPRMELATSAGPVEQSGTKAQDFVSKMTGKAKENLEKDLSPAERAANKGFSNIGTTKNGGPDFSRSDYIMKNENGEPIIATINMSGSRSKDFTRAFDEVNIPSSERKKILEDYTWHHVDDYDEATGKCTMQLVQKDAHVATYPHKGSCAQYDDVHGETYNKKYNGKTPRKKQLIMDLKLMRQKMEEQILLIQNIYIKQSLEKKQLQK